MLSRHSEGLTALRGIGGHHVQERVARGEVLLVDDDVSFVETFGGLLRQAGFVVRTELTYASALRYLGLHTPDALITDIELGAANGWQLAKYAKRYQPDLPVVVITGWCDAREAEVEYFRVPVFLKPFEPDDLLDYLKSTIQPRSAGADVTTLQSVSMTR